jgi:hypothetical protein
MNMLQRVVVALQIKGVLDTGVNVHTRYLLHEGEAEDGGG